MGNLNLDFFTENHYTTRPNSRKLIDKLFLNTRIYFVLKYIQLIFVSRKLALKGIYNRKAWAESSYDVVKLIEHCGGKFHIEGFDNFRNCDEPVVIVSNHMSAMESMIFPAIIAPFMEVTFVVKASLARHFLFGPVMRARDPIAVERSNSREDLMYVMNKGKEFIEKGISVVIFPQGGRRETFIPEEFNSLGVKLAKSTGVKVIPMAIKTDFWGNGKLIKDLGPIRRDREIYITIGEPIEITGKGKEQNNQIVDFIETNLSKWN
ncbi:MAG TPA: 1-acyl-sn-glycerol-3-phosphate acyltransferase [Bacteroidales bacterium]|jgi:1-acyl-sn-glycerol-3-phosphate acyltransferase|nr:1-acyl-sn-glycerol-3-phosphate acyltransferase [Bacteroidales bacterium]